MKPFSLALGAALLSLPFAVGCAASSEGVDTAESDEAEGALSTAAQSVVGAYINDGAGTAGNIQALVIKPDGTFFLDIDRGIRCVRAPCPSTERVTGTVTGGKKTVTLRANEDVDPRAAAYLGRFRYTKTDPSLPTEPKLTLTRGGDSFTLAVKPSFCAAEADCFGQSLLAPACFPLTFQCLDNACSPSCGHPPPLDPCRGADEQMCSRQGICQPEYGPSHCTGSGASRVCTRDSVFKKCVRR